jgi:ABC-type Mn2+/Zn2+ transport system ATPase subunit
MSDNGYGTAAHVEAADLTVGYDRAAVVSSIRFVLDRGATLALVGSNGSGKSTLLRTVAGLLRPVSGSIRTFGAKPGRFPARLAYLNQHNSAEPPLPLRAMDVVRMARFSSLGLIGRAGPEDETLVRHAMSAMDILPLADQPLSSLSGGQRQRVFLAQAFARGADLLLLDEPDNNLDAEGRERYRAALSDAVARGAAAIVATHDISEALRCDATMLLARRVVAYGRSREALTPDALLSTFGVVTRLQQGELVVVEREHGHG